jgi:hypothetical protein
MHNGGQNAKGEMLMRLDTREYVRIFLGMIGSGLALISCLISIGYFFGVSPGQFIARLGALETRLEVAAETTNATMKQIAVQLERHEHHEEKMTEWFLRHRHEQGPNQLGPSGPITEPPPR